MKRIVIIIMTTLLLVGCSSQGSSNQKSATLNQDESTETISDDNTKDDLEQVDYSTAPALVLGAEQFDGVFNPFYAQAGSDQEIIDLVFSDLIGFDRYGEPNDDGLADYEEPEEILNDDGTVKETVYTFRLKDNVTFSDGEPITADDIIFSYKVLSDPYYDGASTFYTVPILGMDAYRYDDPDYESSLSEMKEDAYSYQPLEDEIEAKADELSEIYADYGVTKEDFLDGGQYYESDTLPSIQDDKYQEEENAYIDKNMNDGLVRVPDIEGIEKVDERTVRVTIEGVDPKAIYNLGGIDVVPMHYYGQNYSKGNLSDIEDMVDMPMGSGPYRFLSDDNNIVTLVANDLYYKGAPQIKKIKYQVVSVSNKLEGVERGDLDVADPTASPETLEEVQESDNLYYSLVDAAGYGYIGISANTIPDINVRKGLMCLMNRRPAIKAYYGDLATVLERPMSTVSWAYPDGAAAYYTYDPEEAAKYFEKAGYTLVNGRLTKDGEPLVVNIGIPADGTGDHPSYAIVLEMKTQGEKLGLTVNLTDYSDGNQMFEDVESGQLDVWCAAWSATPDPDMYQIYDSKGPSNLYGLNDETLDEIIEKARQTLDRDERKALYKEALDIVMDEAVEMPVYQRKDMYVFNSDVIDVTTLPENMTPYYGYLSEVEKLQLLTQ